MGGKAQLHAVQIVAPARTSSSFPIYLRTAFNAGGEVRGEESIYVRVLKSQETE